MFLPGAPEWNIPRLPDSMHWWRGRLHWIIRQKAGIVLGLILMGSWVMFTSRHPMYDFGNDKSAWVDGLIEKNDSVVSGKDQMTQPESNSSPLKIEPGNGNSYWKPSFLGAMLVLGCFGGGHDVWNWEKASGFHSGVIHTKVVCFFDFFSRGLRNRGTIPKGKSKFKAKLSGSMYSRENQHIPWEMMVESWTTLFLLKRSLFKWHVNFQGCKFYAGYWTY